MAPNPNVALVLSGHLTGASVSIRRNLGSTGHHVVEMLADHQSYPVTAAALGTQHLGGYAPEEPQHVGGSFLRLLQFDVARSELVVDTFSPALDEVGSSEYDPHQRYDGREGDFRIPLQLTSRRTSFATDAVFTLAPVARCWAPPPSRSAARRP